MNTRPHEITTIFVKLIDEHLADLEFNRATEMFEIEEFARIMCVHPIHLSATVKETTCQSACGIYQEKILTIARRLLVNTNQSVKEIALTLDFEPSQFTKWFKRFNGIGPKNFRKLQILKS